MVALNTQVRIQNKSGVASSTVSLDSFWSSTGNPNAFDPKLAYDPFNDRWIFTAVSDEQTAASSVLIGASQGSDPTGDWNLYRIDADAEDANWADFPSVGFNQDWIVVTVNLFANSGNSFQSSDVYVFEKADLYAGAALSFSFFSDPNAAPTPALTYDNSLATMYLVRYWNGNAMGRGFLRISSVSGTVGSETYTANGPFVSTSNRWAFGPPGGNDFAPQQDTTDKIQNNDARIQNVVYRNGSLWAVQNAFLPFNAPTRTAAQWWQFAADGTGEQFGRVDDSGGTFFYAFPSIAVNSNDDVMLGFSSFSANQYASASYAFRAGTDPVNMMRPVELLKAGEATYFKTFSGMENRWGDYSNTVVDPVNDLEFWTIQEYASSPDFPSGDDRWGTWWGKVTPPRTKGKGQLTSD